MNKIVIIARGGTVQEVLANTPNVSVELIDFDDAPSLEQEVTLMEKYRVARRDMWQVEF